MRFQVLAAARMKITIFWYSEFRNRSAFQRCAVSVIAMQTQRASETSVCLKTQRLCIPEGSHFQYNLVYLRCEITSATDAASLNHTQTNQGCQLVHSLFTELPVRFPTVFTQ
jgi:hypothetical protein